MNGQTNKYDDYEELHEHSGNEKYEIATIVPKNKKAAYIHFDTVNENFVLDAYYEPIKKEDSTYQSLKVGKNGMVKDTFNIHSVLANGIMWDRKYYSTWIINGNTTKHRYITPFADKNYDSKEWLLIFKDWYDQAAVSYYFNGTYYLKIEGKWNAIEKNFDVKNFNFDKRFPNKYAQVRMVELEDHAPSYVVPPEERDSSLIKQMDYESVFEKEVESAGGWTSSTYSAGWWYMQIFMPGGDTLKIKRFSSYRSPDMKLYKIPEEYGGREDVLFIVLEPKDAHPDQVGGMYVVRPRKMGENTTKK